MRKRKPNKPSTRKRNGASKAGKLNAHAFAILAVLASGGECGCGFYSSSSLIVQGLVKSGAVRFTKHPSLCSIQLGGKSHGIALTNSGWNVVDQMMTTLAENGMLTYRRSDDLSGCERGGNAIS